MDQVVLGKTGIRVPKVGLGCGGPSGLGTRTNAERSRSVEVVRRAYELGIRLFDTAAVYGTEDIVGEALVDVDRESAVICTKALASPETTPEELQRSLAESLRRLQTDYIDVYYLHAVVPDEYKRVVDRLYPELQALKSQGLIKHLAISERFNADPGHTMLSQALQENLWDVVMVGFNVLNQSARERVFPLSRHGNVGTVGMFAARLALSRPERLVEVGQAIFPKRAPTPDGGTVDAGRLPELVQAPDSETLVDTAYRFVRDEPGLDVVLVGTGNIEHLEANVGTFSRPSLDDSHRRRLMELFAGVDSVTGQ